MKKWEYQGIFTINGKKFLIIPENEKLHIKNCYFDAIICNKKDYVDNSEIIKTYNIGSEKKITNIFLDEI
jgi:hypothetical protein